MYKGRWFVRERIYICGDYMDADIYPVFQPAGKRRKRCNPTKEIQARINQRNAEKKITRLVHMNFTEKDIALHLTYRESELPADRETAQKDLYNFIRRLKRKYKANERDLKYISCTELGGNTGRVHHHLIISGGLDRDEIEKLWGKGYANSKRLQFEDDGVTGLAHYTVKSKTFFKRWNQSKNLIQPEPIVRDAAVSQRDISNMAAAIESKNAHSFLERRYFGYRLTAAAAAMNDVNRKIYIHFDMKKEKTLMHRGGRARAQEPFSLL